eukprot:CAMPEP_0205831152 /NCGR_PEP_ID=MMETSP0206-20130828/43226_1 /ASSEMBLY_ACC=CAM_ASM_000279 /TAXON_ID=36767 /ORGANISM="Euplotes focardii, Strain TN1" /LENGTH=149 /DNA_ID=CAMNT_0053135507 /DNA_START=22 /DNA_END=468 /DNA_ORIENTATION=+
MRVLSTWTVLAVVACSSLADAAPANGFNDAINWRTWDEGHEEAKASGKPIMLIIHKTWCGACKRLKPEFSSSKDIWELSSKFVMINVEDDDEPTGEQYTPDGGYIPRILFLGSDGEVRSDLFNEGGNPKYKYYYTSAGQIVSAMEGAAA